jgi:hypothetical protein
VALSESTIKLLDIAVKGVLVVMVTGVASCYGSKLSYQREREAETAKSVQAYIDLTSKQKDLDVQLAVQMFSALTSTYLQKETSMPDQVHVRRQMLLLRLVALNFQDVPIQLRPLFEDLDQQLSRDEDRQRLREIAREVATRQAFRLTIGGGYNSGPRTVKSGDVLEIPELLATVTVEKVGKESVRAFIDSQHAVAGRVGPFTVGYYVWPITDNTKLGELRLCVLLLGVDGDQATIRVIAFGSQLAADRFDIKEMSRMFRDKDSTGWRP